MSGGGWRRGASEVLGFGAVGIVNTAVGFTVIVLLMAVAGLSPVAANVGGYAAGLAVSYLLNRRFTFADRRAAPLGMGRYVLVFLIAYGINLGVLHLAIGGAHLSGVLAQALAVAAYSAVFFVLCRRFVFVAGGSEGAGDSR